MLKKSFGRHRSPPYPQLNSISRFYTNHYWAIRVKILSELVSILGRNPGFNIVSRTKINVLRNLCITPFFDNFTTLKWLTLSGQKMGKGIVQTMLKVIFEKSIYLFI